MRKSLHGFLADVLDRPYFHVINYEEKYELRKEEKKWRSYGAGVLQKKRTN